MAQHPACRAERYVGRCTLYQGKFVGAIPKCFSHVPRGMSKVDTPGHQQSFCKCLPLTNVEWALVVAFLAE